MVKEVVYVMGIVFGFLYIEGYYINKGFVVGEVYICYGGDNIVIIIEIVMKCDMYIFIFVELVGILY